MTRVALGLARRALVNNARRVQFLAPIVIFPSLLLAVNVGGLSHTTDLPGFPHVKSFLDFQLAAVITQSLLLGGTSAGIAAALDIEGGFFDRLVVAPIPRAAIVFGRLIAVAVIAALQAVFFLVLGFVFGASVAGGFAGVIAVVAIAVIAGTGFGAIGIVLALRAKSASTVQGVFPLVFVVLFLSSAFFPLDLLSQPANAVAAYNPLSYIANGMRDPIVSGLHPGPIFEGLAAAVGVTAVAVLLSLQALHGRLREE